ncbi:MAG: hypothetical protein U0P47_02150 [Acidimicrobiales bacterium]
MNNTGCVTFEKNERTILANLGGQPWKASQFTRQALRAARSDWLRLRKAVGFTGAGRWLTTELTSPKLAKSGVPSVGVTLHSSLRALAVWRQQDEATQHAIAAALDTTVDDVRSSLMQTMCPRSTSGCVGGCVTTHSEQASLGRTDVVRLVKTLFHLHRPASAFCLTGEELRKLRKANGRKCRWRVNISDDIRWELLAPGLWTFKVPGYAYTKWTPQERPGRKGLSLVYSATERHTDADITNMLRDGHRVAVVLDVRPADLPDVWKGCPVSDGNVTDDLYTHQGPCIVGLSVKGPTLAIKERMRRTGFARPA